jgi:hypothetical protein
MLISHQKAAAMFSKDKQHSKFSASGSERWLKCAFSVQAEEGLESPDTVWSIEGTFAHAVLERWLRAELEPMSFDRQVSLEEILEITSVEMAQYVTKAGKKFLEIAAEAETDLIVERRVNQKFIHPEMFGTTDGGVPELFGTLHVIDFKYGAGHVVDPEENTQLIQYALGLAYEFNWNFDKIRMHIVQPRGSVKKWHKYWEIEQRELKEYWLPIWRKGVARVLKGNNKPFEGPWCHWCKAPKAGRCPAKSKKVDELLNG